MCGSKENEPNISKKFDTKLSLLEFKTLTLKSPIKRRLSGKVPPGKVPPGKSPPGKLPPGNIPPRKSPP